MLVSISGENCLCHCLLSSEIKFDYARARRTTAYLLLMSDLLLMILCWYSDDILGIISLCTLLNVDHRYISRLQQINIMLPPLVQEVIPYSALHFQWQAVSLIFHAIRAINVDRINTCVLAPVPLLEIACHCWQTNIRAWPCDRGEITVLFR